ncbi:hypothetical protein HPB49_026075 [Dermacentor silvarum]|nr:hypothetical protein HPB49_026075 [Dermacentor silvarum]
MAATMSASRPWGCSPFHSSPLVESGGHGGAGCNRVNGPFVNFKLALPGQRICSCALSIKRRTFLPISVLSTSEDYTWIIFVRGLPAHCLIPGHFSIKANASLATAFIWPQRLQLEELIRTSLYPQDLFDPRKAPVVLRATNTSYGVHFWNKLSKKTRVVRGSCFAMEVLARDHCLEAYRVASSEGYL